MKVKIYGFWINSQICNRCLRYDTPKSIGYRETGSSVALPIFKTIIEKYLLYNKNTNDNTLPNDLIIKVNKDNGKFPMDKIQLLTILQKNNQKYQIILIKLRVLAE